jgi:hypothetical protein
VFDDVPLPVGDAVNGYSLGAPFMEHQKERMSCHP